MWDAGRADDALWERLHEHFTEPELVELGFFVALTLGQQRWIKTLDIGHHELPANPEAGLMRTAERDQAAALDDLGGPDRSLPQPVTPRRAHVRRASP